MPKQFLSFLGDNTMLRKTYGRLKKIFLPQNIWVVAKPDYQQIVLSQLREMPSDRLLLEPTPKGTAAAILWATTHIQRLNPFSIVATFPADHFISGEQAFAACVQQGIEWASCHPHIVTFGVQPTRPETGYGYIQIDLDCNKEQADEKNVFYVQAFHEKPDMETAKAYLDMKNYLWNSGIFAFSSNTLQQVIERLCPDCANICKALVAKEAVNHATETEIYAKMPDTSFDEEVMEKLAVMQHSDALQYKIVTVRAETFSWYDIGVWESYYELSEKDEQLNVIRGDKTITIDCKESMALSDEGMAVAVVGLNNVVVVTCADAVLVCSKDSLGKIRDVVNIFKLKKMDDYI